MGPRASRRRLVAGSDDEDEDEGIEVDAEPPIPAKRVAGKLKSVKNGVGSGKTTTTTKKATVEQSPQKSKGKPTVSGKPIYSFFNKATQRQQHSQSLSQPSTSASTENVLVHAPEIESIQDDLDDETADHISTSTALSKGSSTALALRKRKFARTRSFEDDSETNLAPPASQKFRKVSSGHRVPTLSIKNEDPRPWTEQFAPIDLAELAVHKRKVADVRNWLEVALKGRRNKVLVLRGPAGVGKTTTVQLLATDLKVRLVEWKDPSSADYSPEFSLSTAAQFDEFVGRVGKSSGLVLASGLEPDSRKRDITDSKDAATHSDGPQALLIEEFPNTFSKTSSTLQSFRSTIAQYLNSAVPADSSPTPIIMVITETLLSTNTAAADSFTAHRLLGPELLNNPYINVLDFNPVAPTFLIKALEVIVVKEARKSGRRRTPGPLVLKHLAETGDIRSAVSSLEFLCLRGDEGDLWSSKVSFTKQKQSKSQPPLMKAEEEALKLVTNRESSLGIFHSVGKVVYNKRIEVPTSAHLGQPPPWLLHHRRTKIPETDADTLMDELGTDTPTFLASLHENYALSCSSSTPDQTTECMLGCMDNLSDADLLSIDRFSLGTRAFSGSATDTLRQDELSFQVAVRGVLFSLPHPVHRSGPSTGNRGDAHRMFYPASLKLWRRKEEISDKLDSLVSRLSLDGLSGNVKSSGPTERESYGVEGWKRSAAFEAKRPNKDVVDADTRTQPSSELRTQMLLEQLPYLAQILESRINGKSSQLLFDQVAAVTRIKDSSDTGEDGEGAEDAEDDIAGSEQWATDRPDAEAGAQSKKPRLTGQKKVSFETQQIPAAEASIKKLVLEDDDIVDD